MADAAAMLRDAARALAATSDTPRLDAELLMAHALGLTREQLLLRLPDMDAVPGFADLLDRRLRREPVAHILGHKEFWSLSFQVSPAVLIPRPDSELLIAAAVEWGADRAPARILDLGTGSGALLLASLSEFPDAIGVGMDASADALALAHNNADALNLAERAQFLLLDWTQVGWQKPLGERFDLILANPPYVATTAELDPDVADYEPTAALFAGPDGLDDYRRLIPAFETILAPGGLILLEIGFDQAKSVAGIAENHGYHVECKQDFGGQDRLLMLRLRGES